MANMARRQPGAVAKPVAFSANFPSSVYLPNSLLYPAEHGNPNRSFNDQELGELAIENKALLSYALSYNTWATNTDVLTSILWPKVKLREGVHRVEGKRFEYDIVPTTAVPARGTVRFMSKKSSSFSLAIGQKGIGSKFEGRALRSEYGPNLLAMEVQAYAESISLGMALNTAINAVNVAHRAPYLRPGSSYALNKAQEMGREIRLWCSLGLDPTRVNVELGNILTEKPDMNIMLVPEGFENYMQELILTSPAREEAILKQTLREDRVVELESNDRALSITSMANGRITVYPMTSFRYAKTTMQPLSTISRIGEVYPMYGELDAEGKIFLRSSLDIYIYNEPEDRYSKLSFVKLMEQGRIWDSHTEDYSDAIKNYRDVLNKKAANNGLNKFFYNHPQFPLTEAILPHPTEVNASYKGFVLPNFIGNLSEYHLDTDDYVAGVQSAVNQLQNHGMNLSDALDDIKDVDNLRALIEDEPYDSAYWEQVARLNINRSVTFNNANAVFTGVATSRTRASAHGSKILTEWAPNRHGSLDIPNTGIPAGMWSAGGLLTISQTAGHPLKDRAHLAYLFMSTLATKAQDALAGSAVFNLEEMPINMPKNDSVQLVMTACFGPRAPVFLAAPLELSTQDKSSSDQVRRPAQSGAVPTSSVVIAPGILEKGKVKSFTSDGSGIRKAGGTIVIKTTSGIVLVLGDTDQVYKKDSPLFSPDLMGNLILKPFLTLIDTIENDVLESKFIEVLLIQLAGLDNASIKVVARILSKFKSLPANIAPGPGSIGMTTRADFAKIITGTGPIKLEKGIVIDGDIERKLNEGVTKVNDAIAKDIGAKGANVPAERAARLASALEKFVTLRRVSEPGYTPGKLYVKLVNNDAAVNALVGDHYKELTTGNLGTFTSNAAEYRAIREEIAALMDDAVAFPVVEITPDVDVSSSRSSEIALARARFYRTPLNMSYELLVSLARVEFPWILPGDPNDKFDSPADLSLDRGDAIDETIYALPHYVQSKSLGSRQLRSWSDVGMFSRTALNLGVYSAGLNAPRSSGPIRSQGGLLEASYRGGYAQHAQNQQTRAAKPALPAAVVSLVHGHMMHRLAIAVGEWGNNFVRRFAAMAYLMMPLSSIDSLKIMIEHNVMPPFAVLPWRLRSDHEVAGFLVARAGIESGANFYNGAHFDWSQDATRDVYQTRVVITTDAHAIRAENHRIIQAVMPRQYRGGHNDRIVTKPEELKSTFQIRQPSVIATIISRASLKHRLWPVSFINHPPAQIDRVGNDVDAVDIEAQYFEGADFYAADVYGTIYGDTSKLSYDRPVIAQELSYKADPRENHLAMLGFHIKYDYKMRHYCKPIDGNGHRHDRRLNSPGARAYLNGETSVLPPARDIQSFLLS